MCMFIIYTPNLFSFRHVTVWLIDPNIIVMYGTINYCIFCVPIIALSYNMLCLILCYIIQHLMHAAACHSKNIPVVNVRILH